MNHALNLRIDEDKPRREAEKERHTSEELPVERT